MLFDDLLKHPAVKQAIATGEEQATRVVGKLLSDQRVSQGLQELLAAAAAARATVESGVQAALHAANLPTADELRSMRQKLSELEAQVDALNSRLREEDAVAAPTPATPTDAALAGSTVADSKPEPSEP